MKFFTKVTGIEPKLHGRQAGFFWALTGTMAWSSTALFIGMLHSDFGMGPVEIAFWRTFLIALSLFAIARIRHPGSTFSVRPREFALLFLTGVIGIAIFTLAFNISVVENGPAVATTLIFCSPAFVALGGISLLGEKLGAGHAFAILVNLSGCALVAGITDPAQLVKNPLGALLGLGTGLTFAIYILLGKIIIKRSHRSSLVNLLYYFLSGGLVLTVAGLWQDGPALFFPDLGWYGWTLLLSLSVVSLCGYAFFNNSLKYLPASVSSLIQSLEPFMTALLSMLFLGRGLTGLQWLGAILIISGVLSLQILDFSRKPDKILE